MGELYIEDDSIGETIENDISSENIGHHTIVKNLGVAALRKDLEMHKYNSP
ncbi:MAG: hypothetical protein MJY81_00935 [Bacteroidaceae bacterium]|nr:hypothetical protein [Bacteroidaceae bacterium]